MKTFEARINQMSTTLIKIVEYNCRIESYISILARRAEEFTWSFGEKYLYSFKNDKKDWPLRIFKLIYLLCFNLDIDTSVIRIGWQKGYGSYVDLFYHSKTKRGSFSETPTIWSLFVWKRIHFGKKLSIGCLK